MFDTVFYGKCFDLLVNTGNTRSDKYTRQSFISYFTDDRQTKEWRFQGHLGFGGKFWRNDGRHYVSCYQEDETPERLTLIADLNHKIGTLEIDSRCPLPWKEL